MAINIPMNARYDKASKVAPSTDCTHPLLLPINHTINPTNTMVSTSIFSFFGIGAIVLLSHTLLVKASRS